MQFIHSENARKADIINLLKRNQMQKETTANYRHTESLTLFLLNRQGLTIHTLAQIKPQKEKKKEKPSLVRRGQGRWLEPSRGENGAQLRRQHSPSVTSELAARPFSSVRGTSAQLRSRHVRSLYFSRTSPRTTNHDLDLDSFTSSTPNHRTSFLFFLTFSPITTNSPRTGISP